MCSSSMGYYIVAYVGNVIQKKETPAFFTTISRISSESFLILSREVLSMKPLSIRYWAIENASVIPFLSPIPRNIEPGKRICGKIQDKQNQV